MMKRSAIFLLFFLAGFSVWAQVSRSGTPYSFSWPEERLHLPMEIMAPVDAVSLLAEDLIFDTIKDIPWRFGTPIYVDMDMKNAGTWHESENGDRVWRLGIKSPGAYALTLIFDRYILPEGAELYIYNTDRSSVIGAFTDYNNQDDHYFATTLIEGDELVIEYFEPYWVSFSGELKIESVNHAYRDPLMYLKAFGQSGSCNLNVACPQAEGWDQQIRSVALMLTSGTAWCTGALINNTAHDGRPFVLSANHCYRNPGSLVFWFNWQSATCTNPPSSPSYDVVGGLVNRARNSTSDFWLLEFTNPIPEHVNPYFSGWNRTLQNTIVETIVGIHHPSGDIKKFSYATGGVTNSSYLGSPGSGTTHWRITWSGGTTTEGGSSGSPLYDGQGRIIGQLHGGYAACGNTSPDYYGRLGISWTGGGTTATRLSDWLDPIGLNVEAIDGYDPFGEIVEDVTNFEALPLSPSAINLSWEQNENQNPVLVAFNTSATFGNPSGNYYLGQEITGGGQVLYLGTGEGLTHQPLNAASTYYYKIWSQSESGKYSEGVMAQAVTLCPMFDLPFTEDFEENTIPICWEQEFLEGTISWQTGAGNGANNPEGSYSGNINAFIKASGTADYGKKTRLVTPMIYLGDFDLGELGFYLANAANEELQDTLKVYYRASAENEWELLQVFYEDEQEWAEVLIQLPEIPSQVQFAFEATLAGGYGIAIDLVAVSGYYDTEFPAPVNLNATVSGNSNVDLEWAAPELTEDHPEHTGYKIYRNGSLLAGIAEPETTNYVDTGLAIGSYVYEVTAIYQNPQGESEKTAPASVEIEPEEEQFSLTISVQGSGTTTPPPGAYNFNMGAEVSLSAIPLPNHSFVNWIENGEVLSVESVISITINEDRIITAMFAINQHQVVLSSVPENVGVQNGAGTYNYGQTATISTTLPQGYTFRHWKEGETIFSTSPVFQAVITQDRQFVAHFDVNQYEITLVADPASGGTVAGGGIFSFGSEITVTAEAAEGYDFSGWRENGQLVSNQPSYTFTISKDRDLTARFNIRSYLVSTQITPEGSGAVSGGGTYNHGATVNLSAAIYAGYQFVSWEENGEIISTTNPFSFQITSNRNILARLESTARTLVIAVNGLGTTYPPPGSYTHALNSKVSVAAVANPGWHFVKWEINDEVVTESEIEITMSENVNATAFFEESVSVGQLNDEYGIRIYPQPATGILHIEWNKMAGAAVLELFNLSGQRMVVVNEDASLQGNTKTTINIDKLKSGVYLLRITSNGNAVIRKVMIH